MNKILLGIMGAMLLSMLGMALYIKYENTETKTIKQSLVDANREIKQMQDSLKVQASIHDATEEVVTQAVKKTSELTQKAATINQKVDKTHQEVVHEKINNDLANARYLDSMWTLTVKQPQLVPVVPPDSLLIDCTVDTPPDSLGTSDREAVYILVKAWNSQTMNLAKCNVDKQGLRDWKIKMHKIVK